MRHSWNTIGSLEDLSLDGVEAVAADVDHTLFDFDPAQRAAMDAVRAIHPVLGDELQEMFDLVHEGARRIDHATWEHRERYAEVLSAIAGKQGVAVRDVKKWSRETWMQLISDRHGLGLATGDIVEARDAFWKTLGASGGLYPDVAPFAREMEARGIPLVLMTASDSVMATDGTSFRYDPDFAKRYKQERLRMLPLRVADTVIGDPHDKPSTEFYDLVEAAVFGAGAANVGRVLTVGDSPKGDVEVPAQRGYRAYLIERKG